MALRRRSGSCSVVAMVAEDFGAFGACGDEAVDDVLLDLVALCFVVEGLELRGRAHRAELLHGRSGEFRVGFVGCGLDQLVGAAGDRIGLEDRFPHLRHCSGW